MRNIKRILFWSLMLLVMFAEISCFSHTYTGQITLINESNESIKLARIEVCNQVIETKNLKPHEKFKGIFNVTTDSHYDVTIHFASGKALSKQIGYVTRGFDFQDTLVITGTTITINREDQVSATDTGQIHREQ